MEAETSSGALPVAGIWVRRVPPNNFFSIERRPSAGPAGGGGALYLEAPASTVPALLELLGRASDEPVDREFSIPTRAVGAPGVVRDLRWNSKTGNRMRLFQNRQSEPEIRHPAWSEEMGFPTAPDDVATKDEAAQFIAEGLAVYVAKTIEGEYFAGFLAGPYPEAWPGHAGLKELFSRGGVKQFDGGLALQPADQALPFVAQGGSIVVARGGVVEPEVGVDIPEAGQDTHHPRHRLRLTVWQWI